MKVRQNVILASHVMSRLHFAAERRAPENHFLLTQIHRVGEVGVAGRKLSDFQQAVDVREVSAKERLKTRYVKFLAGADFARVVAKIGWHYVDTCKPYFFKRLRATTILCTSSGPS